MVLVPSLISNLRNQAFFKNVPFKGSLVYDFTWLNLLFVALDFSCISYQSVGSSLVGLYSVGFCMFLACRDVPLNSFIVVPARSY